jgi:hypothetical protein
MRRLSVLIPALTVAVWAIACSSSQPLSPSAASPGGTRASIDAFTGSWGASSASSSASLPNGCTKFDYQVDRLSDSSAKVTVDANCASVAVTGSGQGTVSGSVLSWTASGNATARGLTCPFTFNNSTATPEGNGVRVNYSGTVCGLPVQGSELLTRR